MRNSAETCPVSWLTVYGKRGPTFSVTTIGALCPLLSISKGPHNVQKTLSNYRRCYRHYRRWGRAPRCGGSYGRLSRPVVRQIRPGAASLGLRGDRMTTRELSALIGKEGLLSIHPIRVAVRVLDSRVVYSRVDCLITPIAGNGQQWVSRDRLDFGD